MPRSRTRSSTACTRSRSRRTSTGRHRERQGLAFDAFAEDYDLGRPPWPAQLLDGVQGGSVLDLAAGTGKLTALLVERLEVAEAFHWFDSVAAVRELARVLRPGGTLLVCFNEWLGFEPSLPDTFRNAHREVASALLASGGPKVQSGEWKLGFDGAPFEPFAEEHHRHTWATTCASVAAYFVSTSSMGSLEPAERVALRGRLIALLPAKEYRLELDAHAFRTLRT